MSYPSDSIPDALTRQIVKVYEALKKRLNKEGDYRAATSWTFHEGAPDLTNLPQESVGVWLGLPSVRRSTESAPWNSEQFILDWPVEIILQDRGSDPFGFGVRVPLEAQADVLNLLTQEFADTDLDGDAEFSDNITISPIIGVPSGGDRAIAGISIRVEIWLGLVNCRLPSGV